MVRSKRPEPSSPQPSEAPNRKRSGEGSSAQADEQRKKARNEARYQLIEEKNVTCERPVDRRTLTASHVVVKTIEALGMGFWFKKVCGFNLAKCREFYQKLKVVDGDGKILKTNVRGKSFEVTPTVIATLLEYERPPPSTSIYPHNVEKVAPIQDFVNLMYDDPTLFKGTVHAGGLKHDFGLMNKILHYNLFPKGAEKMPNVEKLGLLDAVMTGKKLDIALFIWEVMKDFAENDCPRANLPYGNLVTRMCDHFGVKGIVSDKITPPEAGAIGQASSSKRSAMTRTERAKPTGPGSSSAGPSLGDPSEPRPSTAMPDSLIARRLDSLEGTVLGMETVMQGMAAMMKDLYVHTFPRRPVQGGPSTSPVVEDGDDDDDSDVQSTEGEGESD